MDASQVGSEISREEFRELIGEVRELRRRVSALEHHAPAAAIQTPAPPLPSLHVSSDTAPAIGKALLAIAGAYLLRALTEWHFVPASAGVVLGMLYAGFWMWRAVRAESKLRAIVNSATAVFILGPLTWEATLNLHAIPTWAAAGAVAVFSIAPIGRREAAAIASASSAAIAFALLIATHDLVPFTAALLAIAAVSDWTALPVSWFAALCADAAIAILTITIARGVPEGYAPVSMRHALAAQAILFLVFVGGAVYRTAARKKQFSVYEIGQTAMAFTLAIGGAFYLTSARGVLGTFVLLCCAACYWIALRVAKARAVDVYATFGTLLAIFGASLASSGLALIGILSGLAIGISWTALGKIQAPALLLAALWISGIASATAAQLFGGSTEFSRSAAALICAASVVCFVKSSASLAAAVIGACALWSAAGIAVTFGAEPAALIVFAIALAWGGTRWKRPELVWLMYGCMAVAGAKIVLYDFGHQATAWLVVSLLVYGAGLIAIPRILQKR